MSQASDNVARMNTVSDSMDEASRDRAADPYAEAPNSGADQQSTDGPNPFIGNIAAGTSLATMQLDIPPTASSTDPITAPPTGGQPDDGSYVIEPGKSSGYYESTPTASSVSKMFNGDPAMMGQFKLLNGLSDIDNIYANTVYKMPWAGEFDTGPALDAYQKQGQVWSDKAAAQSLSNSQAQGQWLNSQARADMLQQQATLNAFQIITNSAPNIFGTPITQNPIFQYTSPSDSDIPALVAGGGQNSNITNPSSNTYSSFVSPKGQNYGGDIVFAYNNNGINISSQTSGANGADFKLLSLVTGTASVAGTLAGGISTGIAGDVIGATVDNLVSREAVTGTSLANRIILDKFKDMVTDENQETSNR